MKTWHLRAFEPQRTDSDVFQQITEFANKHSLKPGEFQIVLEKSGIANVLYYSVDKLAK